MKIFHLSKSLAARLLSCILIGGASGVFAQTAPPVPLPPVVPSKDMSGEKALPAAENVSVQLCVQNGNVRVSGWTRGEIRVLTDGTDKDFVLRKLRSDAQNLPVWVAVESNESAGECLSGDIEINLPQNASFSLKSAGTANISAENVRKVNLTLYAGDAVLNEIGREIEINTLSGNIVINDSQGKFTVGSMSGNILVRRVAPLEVSDVLRVKSQSGDVTLFAAEHNSVIASTNLGTITFSGNPLSNATYDFRTNIGDIRLIVPSKANFSLNIISMEQKINSPLSFKVEDCRCSKNAKQFTFGTQSANSNFNLNVYDGRISVQPSDNIEKR